MTQKKIQTIVMSISIFGLAVMFGCASVQDAVTPCYIPKDVLSSVNVDVPVIPWMPYTSLFDARFVKTKMYYQHLLYNSLMTTSIQASEEFQQRLFSPTGPIGLLFPTLMGGSLGALLIKRPGDKSKKEVEKENK